MMSIDFGHLGFPGQDDHKLMQNCKRSSEQTASVLVVRSTGYGLGSMIEPRWRSGAMLTRVRPATSPPLRQATNKAPTEREVVRLACDRLWPFSDLVQCPLLRRDVVASNRRGVPEGVIDAVEQLAPQGFGDIDQVLPYDQREAIVRGYAAKAGFAARVVARS